MAIRSVPPQKPRKPSSSSKGPEPDSKCFSRELAVDSVPDSGLDIGVDANEAECAALAEECGLAAIHELEAGFQVRKLDRARFKVTGSLRARVTQICVVSLEPFETLVEAGIDVDFAPSGVSGGGLAAAFHGGEDFPDPIVDGKIDLGALAAEFLVLNLDVHPRKPGVSFDAAAVHGETCDKNSPFAVLRPRS
jgi:Large ribosomal RNA subunit accumulation protein YceD